MLAALCAGCYLEPDDRPTKTTDKPAPRSSRTVRATGTRTWAGTGTVWKTGTGTVATRVATGISGGTVTTGTGKIWAPWGPKAAESPDKKKDPPVFTLAWSEHPSWSVFAVASDLGLIDGRKGRQGPLEKKWGVDVELYQLEYDGCIDLYAAGRTDAVCVSSLDLLFPSQTVDTVAILPTSTSAGADALLVVGIDPSDRKKAIQELKKVKVFGLEKSASEYVFDRNLELSGEKERDYQFTNAPAELAARAMQRGREEVKAIVAWNPFVIQTLKANQKTRRLFDSSTLPEELIDLVAVSRESLAHPKGPNFACCLIDTFYSFNRLLEDKSRRGELLSRLGRKFSNFPEADMEQALKEAPFYKDAAAGLKLFKGDRLPESMKRVSKFCLAREMIKKEPAVALYGRGDPTKVKAQLYFDPTFMEKARDRK
jgi:NitT/TauT family transport system substrate-binding protein